MGYAGFAIAEPASASLQHLRRARHDTDHLLDRQMHLCTVIDIAV